MQNTMLDSVVSSNSQELSNASASSALKLFENPQFRVRVIMRCADPWFVAKDACDCLELTNVSKACQTLDEDEKGITKVYTLGGSQDMMLISESGAQRRILKSGLRCQKRLCGDGSKSSKKRIESHWCQI